MKTIRLLWLSAALFVTVPMCAQNHWNDYARRDSMVSYQGQVLANADAATFVELGFGYGKDKFNVYYRGEVLEFVNPNTFEVSAKYTRRHRIGDKKVKTFAGDDNDQKAERTSSKNENPSSTVLAKLGLGTAVSGEYTVTNDGVKYEGQPVKGAEVASFEVLKAGYAKDKHHAYYMGQAIPGALGGKHFQYTSDDYATDGLHTYFKGKEVVRD
ncbi:MAG: DKNYY domain-containing protein [Prevotella sp.]